MKPRLVIKDNDFLLLMAGASMFVSAYSGVTGNYQALFVAAGLAVLLLLVSWVRFE